MAEYHPVGFQWVVEAKERGAKVIHVDPRFTRTSALRRRASCRCGPAATSPSSAAIVRYILEDGTYVPRVRRALHQRARRSSAEDFRDTEDLDGALLRAGTPRPRTYDPESWQYEGIARWRAAAAAAAPS